MARTLKELKQFATQLKVNATKSEMKLHRYLTKNNIKFKFQHVIQPIITA